MSPVARTRHLQRRTSPPLARLDCPPPYDLDWQARIVGGWLEQLGLTAVDVVAILSGTHRWARTVGHALSGWWRNVSPRTDSGIHVAAQLMWCSGRERTDEKEATVERKAEHEPESQRVPIAQEQVSVGKAEKVRGKLLVRVTPTDRVERVTVPIREDRVEIRRVPVERRVDTVPQTRQEGDTLIVPIVEERLVVEKQLVLREEIHILRHSATRQADREVELRSETVTIERQAPQS